MTPWEASAFVSTPENVPVEGVVPPWITKIWVQIASGLGPPSAPLSDSLLGKLRSRYSVGAWVWCAGPTQPGGGEPEAEAGFHALEARRRGFTDLISNQEEFYDAHGNQDDVRFSYPKRYLKALNWDGPLGLTTTPFFASDMSAWFTRPNTIVMPQAFSKAIPEATLTACVEHMKAWGWPVGQQRPLIQSYTTNGQRPDPNALVQEAMSLGVGGIPYTVEQACDDAGLAWLAVVEPVITWPQIIDGGEDVILATLIGSNHGVTAACNRLRDLDPKGTALQKQADKWPAVETLGSDLSKYKAWDKLERSLKILCQDHDAEVKP